MTTIIENAIITIIMSEINKDLSRFPEYLSNNQYPGIEKALMDGVFIHFNISSGILRVATLSKAGVPLAIMEEPTFSQLLHLLNDRLEKVDSFEVTQPYGLFVDAKRLKADRVAYELSYDEIERSMVLGATINVSYLEDSFHVQIENYSRSILNAQGLGVKVRREALGTSFTDTLLHAFLANEELV